MSLPVPHPTGQPCRSEVGRVAALVVLRRRGRAGAPRHRGRTKASEETGFPKGLMDGLRGHVPDVLVDFNPDRG